MSRLLLLFTLTGCAHWQHTELYFGLATPDGAVSAADWQKFVDEEVTRRLPAGFTVVEASGQWRSAAGATVREPSRVMLILHPCTHAFDLAIEEVRRVYSARFHQESVLRADQPSRVSLQ